MTSDFRLVIDFGLVVLIWLVQLIIYPSFRYCDKGRLKKWHDQYTALITLFVVPLMFGQVAVIGYQIWLAAKGDPRNLIGIIAAAALVAICWLATFLFSMPAHQAIANGAGSERIEAIERLIRTNWARTIAWTVVFVLGILTHLDR